MIEVNMSFEFDLLFDFKEVIKFVEEKKDYISCEVFDNILNE